jgi:hypothetical protein
VRAKTTKLSLGKVSARQFGAKMSAGRCLTPTGDRMTLQRSVESGSADKMSQEKSGSGLRYTMNSIFYRWSGSTFAATMGPMMMKM